MVFEVVYDIIFNIINIILILGGFRETNHSTEMVTIRSFIALVLNGIELELLGLTANNLSFKEALL